MPFLVDLRGIEPLSENPSIRVSSITAVCLSFPPADACRPASAFSSFIRSYPIAKLRRESSSQFIVPVAQAVSNLWPTAAIRQRTRNYLLRLYLSSVFLRGHGPRMAAQTSGSPSKPVQAQVRYLYSDAGNQPASASFALSILLRSRFLSRVMREEVSTEDVDRPADLYCRSAVFGFYSEIGNLGEPKGTSGNPAE